MCNFKYYNAIFSVNNVSKLSWDPVLMKVTIESLQPGMYIYILVWT